MAKFERLDENMINQFIKNSSYPSLNESESFAMKKMLAQQGKEVEKLLSEGTLSGDIASFTPILVPVIRRAFPTLIGTEIAGVQPLSTPSGYLYAMVTRYTNDGGVNALSPSENTILFTLKKSGTGDGNEFNNASTTPVDISFETATNFKGKVVYAEKTTKGADVFQHVLVKVTAGFDQLPAIGEKWNNAAAYGATEKGTMTAMYQNEAMWLKVLKNYTGPYATAKGEGLGTDMKEIGMEVTRVLAEAKTRKLKGVYTIEMLQDLKSQHGLDAEKEIIAMLSNEVALEIDRSIIAKANEIATPVSDFDANSSAGRWEIEKYRMLGVKITNEAREIGRQTRKAGGNKLIVSPKVSTILDQIGNFVLAPAASSVNTINSGVKPNLGKFDNRYDVIVDNFADFEYVTVAYKGASQFDAGLFYAPYNTSMQNVIDPASGKPGVILSNRYDIVGTSLHPEAYFRMFSVNLAGTVLA